MSISILAIDDSRTMRDLLRLTLEDAGFFVTTAEDGADGVRKLADTNPDVIITDINMPGMDGFGFIETVRSTGQNTSIPILVLSTENSPELKDRARSVGATGWIVKPFNDSRLVSAIRRVARL
ncbi:two-component system, chemotaxis family, response regulator CheY [Sulfitobacter marinus]|uniref:Two-component system, chemotaxis family, response regulator CheY n=1 Tax=Sulfitobacter marinus TaxID=394264 RepID=A0A1I6QYU8_9RHOB|nr:response regulator [Sulfitobacter marinus]SFS57575.1 two-component system, chemotaxis family, response regulator CheY [Sulfitobacter marinus]